MYCPGCGRSNPSGAVFCNACGQQLPSLSTAVRCPFCGADGQEYQLNCTKCGKDLPKERKIDRVSEAASQPTASTPTGATRACPICGRPMGIYASQCDYCSRPEVDYENYSESSYRSESELPVIGGVLILIAGVLGLVHGLLTLGAVSEIHALGYNVPGSVTCCAGLMCLFGLIAGFGGYNAIKRESLAFAIVGGVFGILSIGFLIGALLSLIGIVIVAVSHDEFSE